MKTLFSAVALSLYFFAAVNLHAQESVPEPEELNEPEIETPAEIPDEAAEEEPSEPAPSVGGEGVLVFPDEEPEEPAEGEVAETISVDFPDEEIRTVLRNIADLFEINLVIPDTLEGRTSIKLRNVTWRQVFDVVLSPIGYTHVEENNIVKVVSLESLQREPPVTEVFILNYSQADEVRGTLEPLVSREHGGRIQTDTRSNALVVTERPTRLKQIATIIERLDTPTAQVMIESKFIETTNRELKDIGVNWASLQHFGVRAGPFNRQWQRSSEQTRGDVRESTSGEMDTDRSESRQRSVNESHFHDGTPSLSGTEFDTGTNLGRFGGSGFATEGLTSAEREIISGFSRLQTFADQTTQGRSTSAVFSADQFEVILSALQSHSDVKLVSNPTIVALNNTPALISIGERFPVPEFTFNPERGTFEVSGFSFEDIGINLNVVPQVNARGFINLNIRPEVSSRAGTTSFGGAGGAEIPIIASRRTESQISIKDGYTLAIGGLVENLEGKSETKVPVLGSMPGLGRLFRSEHIDKEQRNLIIFITARTLNPDGSTYQEVLDPRVMRQMGIREQDIPGYRPDLTHFPTQEEIEAMEEADRPYFRWNLPFRRDETE